MIPSSIPKQDYTHVTRLADEHARKFFQEYTSLPSIDQYSISKHIKQYILEENIAQAVVTYPFSGNILAHASQEPDGLTMIAYNTILDEPWDPRKQFTLCHELGHILLGHPINEIFVLDTSVHGTQLHKYEIEANIFAGNLILPINVFLSQIGKGYHKRQIAKVSQVSTRVIEVRIEEILQRRFLLSDAYVSFVLDNYLKADSNAEVKNTVLYKLFQIYNLYLNNYDFTYADYYEASSGFSEIAANIVSEYTQEIVRVWE